MRNSRTKTALISLALLAGFGGTVCICAAEHPFPKGVMLNLDLQHIETGLIPNKTLYPLHVPLGRLETKTVNGREILLLKEGQGLDIPHSSLLDPDGGEWVATIRVFLKSDGIILSQGNGQTGYVIYSKDGVIHAAIRTGGSVVVLRESPENGIDDCLGKWITIDLQIQPEQAILNLNRARVATAPLPSPLSGKECKIRIGEHPALPAPLQFDPSATPTGATGAIASLKILRQ